MNVCSYIQYMKINTEHTTDIFKLLSDPTRVKILEVLMKTRTQDICVKEIAQAVEASHSATSHQLAKLEAKGIVSCKRVGQTSCYSLSTDTLARGVESILIHSSNVLRP
mgnify:CR=1 FL=1